MPSAARTQAACNPASPFAALVRKAINAELAETIFNDSGEWRGPGDRRDLELAKARSDAATELREYLFAMHGLTTREIKALGDMLL